MNRRPYTIDQKGGYIRLKIRSNCTDFLTRDKMLQSRKQRLGQSAEVNHFCPSIPFQLQNYQKKLINSNWNKQIQIEIYFFVN